MKKLIPIIVIVAISCPILFLLLKALGVKVDLRDIAQTTGLFAGWSMIAVGVIAMILASAYSDEKDKVYQGGFCALLGIAISQPSLFAFITAIALFAWMDFRGRSLK